jgi:hypothetical protein
VIREVRCEPRRARDHRRDHARRIAKIMREPDHHIANEVSRMLGALAAAALLWEAELVERVVHQKVEGWSRAIAIRRLALLRGPDIARVAAWQPKEPMQKRLRM